jgi:uncharacterized repeat protein (TIGR01451 family)
MKLLNLCRVLMLTLGLFLLAGISLCWTGGTGFAQGSGPVEMIKRLNRASNVVRVGETLSFTIALTNHSAFSLTNVTLVDNYDNTTLAFVGAAPPPDQHNPAAATIIWDNVAAPPIPPGGSVVVTVRFIAEHPKATVVNYARAQDIIDSRGELVITATNSVTQEAVGGAAPVFKSLWPTNTIPIAGLPLTFTHRITNDGAATMTHLPLTDTYDPNFLEFNFAIPTPTITSPPGRLVWTDLTTYFGNIPPFETVIVTTVFTALTEVDATVNQASTEGAIDEYDNDLAGGAAQVPITIIESPTAAPTATPTQEPTPAPTSKPTRSRSDEATPTPAPTATATPFIAPTLTPTSFDFPDILPETGRTLPGQSFVWFCGLGLLAAGWYLVRRVT